MRGGITGSEYKPLNEAVQIKISTSAGTPADENFGDTPGNITFAGN